MASPVVHNMLANQQSAVLHVSQLPCRAVRLHTSSCVKPVRDICICRAQSRQRQIRRDAMQERQRNKTEKLRVLRLISACVESNVSPPSSRWLSAACA